MGNCLVTKLKGSVDNNDLPRLGGVVIRGCRVLHVEYSEASQPEIIDGGVFPETGTSKLPAGTSFDISLPEAHTLLLPNKYKIVRFQDLGTTEPYFKIEDLSYCTQLTMIAEGPGNPIPEGYERLLAGDFRKLEQLPSLTYLGLMGKTPSSDLSIVERTAIVDLADMVAKCPNLTYLGIRDYNVRGDITAIANLTQLSGSLTLNDRLGHLFGDFNALGRLINVTSFFVADMAYISGSYEGFVAEARAAGKTTGSATMSYTYSANITWRGEIPRPDQFAPFDYNPTLSWTENTITFLGETINA